MCCSVYAVPACILYSATMCWIVSEDSLQSLHLGPCLVWESLLLWLWCLVPVLVLLWSVSQCCLLVQFFPATSRISQCLPTQLSFDGRSHAVSWLALALSLHIYAHTYSLCSPCLATSHLVTKVTVGPQNRYLWPRFKNLIVVASLYTYVIVFWVLSNQPAFITMWSIPWWCYCDLLLLFFAGNSVYFWFLTKKTFIANNGFT